MDRPYVYEKPASKEEKRANQQQANTNEDGRYQPSIHHLPAIRRMKVADYLKTSLFPSTPTYLTQTGTKKIGKTIFLINGRVLTPKDSYIYGRIIGQGKQCRPSYIWNTMPPHPMATPLREIVPYVSGTIGAAREIETEIAAFEIYMTQNMLQTILNHTNDEIKISEYYMSPKPSCAYSMSISELKAFIGILFMSAVKKDNNILTSFLWGVCGSDIYNTVMSKERFEYLSRCLRFDEYTLRETRKRHDSFTQIRQIWEEFIKKCSEVFRPSLNCTIDEIYIEFNGNCNFKLPLPNQPQKYGIKLLLLCDSNNRYIMSGVPNLDRNKNGTVPFAEYMVEKLITPIRGTHINITYANEWLTSISFTKRLLQQYKVTTVCTLHKNQLEVPSDMITTENRPVGSSIFVYNMEDELQLCTHCPMKGKVDILLSNMHFKSVIKEPDGVPETLTYYNSTKSGVTLINKQCRGYTCSRQTSHWFIAIFYTILDMAGINSLTILNLNRSRYGKPLIRRVDFLYKLALDLMMPHMHERLSDPSISDSVKNKIKNIIDERQKLNIDLNPSKSAAKAVNQNDKPIRPVKTAYKTQDISISSKPMVKQNRDIYPRKSESLLNLTMQNLETEWNQFHSFYVHSQLFRPISNIWPLSMNVQHILAMYPFMQSGLFGQPFSPYLNSNWVSIYFMMQQIQAMFSHPALQLITPMQQLIPYMNIPISIPPKLTVEQIQLLYPPIPTMQSVFTTSKPKVIKKQTQAACPPAKPTPPVQPNTSNENKKMNTTNQDKEETVEYNRPSIQSTESYPPRHYVAGYKKEMCQCGVCDAINEKKFFEECAKCTVLLCTVHRKVLCTDCFIVPPLERRPPLPGSKKAKCGLCKNQGLIKFSLQCSMCSKFLCLEHREIVCCFCYDM